MGQHAMRTEEASQGFFAELERFERGLSPPASMGFKRDAWWILVTALGMLLAFTRFTVMFGKDVQLWLSVAGLVLQFVGLSVISYRQTKDIIPDFVDAKRKYADELDQNFAARERVVAWLKALPVSARNARLRYVEARLESVRARYALIFGAVEKLGVLPVLVGVFVQIQAWKSMSVLAMMLGGFIVGLYLMALWVMGFRLQLEGYARLIRAAEDRCE